MEGGRGEGRRLWKGNIRLRYSYDNEEMGNVKMEK
jgi:hypothetical protein